MTCTLIAAGARAGVAKARAIACYRRQSPCYRVLSPRGPLLPVSRAIAAGAGALACYRCGGPCYRVLSLRGPVLSSAIAARARAIKCYRRGGPCYRRQSPCYRVLSPPKRIHETFCFRYMCMLFLPMLRDTRPSQSVYATEGAQIVAAAVVGERPVGACLLLMTHRECYLWIVTINSR